jgi:hypothetical protein
MEINVEAELEATTQAVIAADQALDADEKDGLQWERNGLLQRLVRGDQSA